MKSIKGCRYIISSGHRTKEHNKRVGGAKNSYHLTDRARDIVSSSMKCKKQLFRAAKKKGLFVIWYKKHLHVDNR